MMTVPCECSGLWDCTGLGRTYFLESGWFLRTAATSAAPRPEPSVESIRSNWYSTPISWEMRDLGRHTWQHADKHCKLASRKNGTGTIRMMQFLQNNQGPTMGLTPGLCCSAAWLKLFWGGDELCPQCARAPWHQTQGEIVQFNIEH